jgi:hypothetical protein
MGSLIEGLISAALELMVELAQSSRSARLRAFVIVALIFGCVAGAIAVWMDN